MNKDERLIEPNLDSPILTNNQMNPNQNHINNLQSALKSQSQLVACPYCKSQDFTKIESECSNINLFFCIISLGLLWTPHQCLRNKDYNCYNAKHSCVRCGQMLADYRAC
jgi:hypothetical protein